MMRYADHVGPWGTFVDAKVNCADVLAREVSRKRPGRVVLGSVTDAYQPVEEEFGLTRACLEVLAGTDFQVSILTKSDLVLRDSDLISDSGNVDVGFTLTTLDESVAGVFEPSAPPPDRRLAAMQELSGRGVDTWAFLGPLIPGVSDTPDALRALISAVENAGAGHILIDSMNLRHAIRKRITECLRQRSPEHLSLVIKALMDHNYKREVTKTAQEAASGAGIPVEICSTRAEGPGR
jgi:DNA repair photolyase